MTYEVREIGPDEASELRERYGKGALFSSKADINGICVELLTSNRDHLEMWEDNFFSSSEYTRSHARLYCIFDTTQPMHVRYDISTFTAFLFNFDYYGWIKSIGLGIAGNILEEAHKIYSVHGAVISVDGIGVTLIAPSKTGKTTQSWGLLSLDNASLVSDDWYFVSLGNGRPLINGSEKNCYIDADICDVWSEYRPLVRNVIFDNNDRGIANVRWIAGEDSVTPTCTMRYIILLKRDKNDPEVVRKITAEEALDYLVANDLCNPHQIVRNDHKRELRKNFFARYLSRCETFMVNTTTSPEETQKNIRSLIVR